MDPYCHGNKLFKGNTASCMLLLLFSRPVMSDSLRPQGLQHTTCFIFQKPSVTSNPSGFTRYTIVPKCTMPMSLLTFVLAVSSS